jgi:aminomuconate-semialdehyde/2-hydroxymuconate-6-semialdehyde dehydrogenase
MRQTDEIGLFIDGARVTTGRWFDDVDPATGQVHARVAEAGVDEVDRAVQAAQRAIKGPWGRLSLQDRCALLERVADGIMARFDDFLAAEVRDTGKPVSLARTLDIPRGAANFRIFAAMARAQSAPSYMTDTADGAGALNYAIRQPIGPIGVICPWNLPLLLMTWKVAPALAVGNTVVVKPSEETPGTATLLAEVMRDVGVPAGVYNVVHGFGPGSAGEAITHHPGLRAITFTGETHTGRAIMRGAAPHLKKLSFELGGKNAAVVFADADVEAAIEGVARSSFTNTGQVCLCSERVYVQRPIFDRFVAGLVRCAAAYKAGDPWSEQTTLGPLISAAHRDKVMRYMQLARDEGAVCEAGGQALTLGDGFVGGFWVAPTVWTGLKESARCVREEIFGPVCHVQPFDDEDEAVALANDSDYGLCAAVWTTNLARAHRTAHALEAGLVWVNSWYLRDLRTPFGGVKASGIGREGGEWSMDFYSEVRNICIKL